MRVRLNKTLIMMITKCLTEINQATAFSTFDVFSSNSNLKDSLTIIHFNVRLLQKNFDAFMNFLVINLAHVIVFV